MVKKDVEIDKAEERKRIKSLAFSKGMLSKAPSKLPPGAPLPPSKTVIKHQGRDIVKKGQRKNRFLFSFPGFLAPASSGGKIGELSNLATGNPVLYLDFPQGRVKLFGTIVYPKNRYLTLQFARKDVVCEDSFDSMVIFSDAWWIGRKDDNPEEYRMEFPNELNKGKQDCDFNGGAGDLTREKSAMKVVQPDIESDDSDSEDSNHAIKDVMQVTPTRQSTRIAGKLLNYAEDSSGEEPIIGEADDSDEMDNETIGKVFGAAESKSKKPDSEMPNTLSDVTHNNREKQRPEETSSPKHPGNKTSSKRTLVQTKLSALFTKATER